MTNAWTPVISDNGITLGLATAGIRGYSPLKDMTGLVFETWKEAQVVADRMNAAFGLTTEEALRVVARSQTAS